MELTVMFPPKENKLLNDFLEKEAMGLHLDITQTDNVLIIVFEKDCPTRAHGPNPRYANVTPKIPEATFEYIPIIAGVLKSKFLFIIQYCMLPKEPMNIETADSLTMFVKTGVCKKSDINGDNRQRTMQKASPIWQISLTRLFH